MAARRFAITASDRYMGVFEAFLQKGWEPVKLFAAPTDERVHNHKGVLARAAELKIDIQMSRMTERDLADLGARGCDLLVVASYQWRIGNWSAHLPHAVNFHPAPLPAYRGPYPLVWGILDQQTRWGTTCHKVAAEFDTGDILAQRCFDMSADETHESLDLKTQMATKRLAHEVAGHFDALWANAQPQGPGHYAHLWTEAQRNIDFNESAEQIKRQLRAFGRWECVAMVNQVVLHVQSAVAWTETHQFKPGEVVHNDGQRFVLACRDGFVGLLQWSLLAPGVLTGTPER